ncbi:MAG: hypothetical protein II573_02980 [Ruminococcus sp.]|nr:hypothetical protein [Ruminococcus sp.]
MDGYGFQQLLRVPPAGEIEASPADAGLWAELFLENREPLVEELDILIENITRIIDAIKDEDKERLYALLEQGHQVKQALGE